MMFFKLNRREQDHYSKNPLKLLFFKYNNKMHIMWILFYRSVSLNPLVHLSMCLLLQVENNTTVYMERKRIIYADISNQIKLNFLWDWDTICLPLSHIHVISPSFLLQLVPDYASIFSTHTNNRRERDNYCAVLVTALCSSLSTVL